MTRPYRSGHCTPGNVDEQHRRCTGAYAGAACACDCHVACSVEDCTEPRRSLRLCEKHYYRMRRTGSVELLDRHETIAQTEARFVANVMKTPTCWIFTGTVTTAGYGQFCVAGKVQVASRVAHQLWIGPIPEGYQVDHVWERGCTDTRCVNPDHLEAVTPRENALRGGNQAALNARKTCCKRGHELSGSNLYVDSNGWRVCRECTRARRVKTA